MTMGSAGGASHPVTGTPLAPAHETIGDGDKAKSRRTLRTFQRPGACCQALSTIGGAPSDACATLSPPRS